MEWWNESLQPFRTAAAMQSREKNFKAGTEIKWDVGRSTSCFLKDVGITQRKCVGPISPLLQSTSFCWSVLSIASRKILKIRHLPAQLQSMKLVKSLISWYLHSPHHAPSSSCSLFYRLWSELILSLVLWFEWVSEISLPVDLNITCLVSGKSTVKCKLLEASARYYCWVFVTRISSTHTLPRKAFCQLASLVCNSFEYFHADTSRNKRETKPVQFLCLGDGNWGLRHAAHRGSIAALTGKLRYSEGGKYSPF